METRINKTLLALLLMFAITNISWASIIILLANAPALVTAFWRLILSSIITVFLWVIIDRSYFIDIKLILLMVISGISLALHFALWIESLFYLPVAISVVLVTTHPIFSVVLAHFFIREKPSRFQVLGMSIAFLGVIMLTRFYATEMAIDKVYGVFLAVLGGIFGSVYFTIGRFVRKKVSTWFYTSISYIVASLVLLMFNIVFNTSFLSYFYIKWTYFIALALVPMLGGHTILNFLLRYGKVVTITTAILGEPVGASILAYIILNQTISLDKVFFMMIIMLGIFIVIRGEVIILKH